MPISRKNRPLFSAEEKLAVLHMQRLLDPALSILTICRQVGITPKTYYAWSSAYQTKGFDGLKPVERGTYGETTSSPERVKAILELARFRPHWPNHRLHAALQGPQGPSLYALRCILTEHGLDSVEARVGAVEEAIIRGDWLPDEDTFEALCRVNPCLEDWFLMGERPRYPVGLDSFPVGRFGNRSGYRVVLAVDFDSLFLLGMLARSPDAGNAFLLESLSRFRRPRGSFRSLVIWGDVPGKVFDEEIRCAIPVNDETIPYLLSEKAQRSDGALQFIRAKVIRTLLQAVRKVNTMEEAQKILDSWLDTHNQTPGSPLYPCFGRKPIDLLSLHTRPKVRITPLELSRHFESRRFRKNRDAAVNP